MASAPKTDDSGEKPDSNGDEQTGRLSAIREQLAAIFERDQEPEPTPRAELVDGAEILFIDAAAGVKSAGDFDLTLITAPQYPEPAVLRCSSTVTIEEGSILSSAGATLMTLGEKRIIVRECILVPPDRVDEVDRDEREELPEAIHGETIPKRGVQNEKLYNAAVTALKK